MAPRKLYGKNPWLNSQCKIETEGYILRGKWDRDEQANREDPQKIQETVMRDIYIWRALIIFYSLTW